MHPRLFLFSVLLIPRLLCGQSTYSTDFEDGTKSGTYISGTDILNGVTWTLQQAQIGSSSGFDRFNGSKSLRIRHRTSGNSGLVYMNSDVTGIDRISFKYARFSGDASSPVIAVEYSTNGGSSWTQAGSNITTAGVTTLTEWTHDLNIAGNVRIRFRSVSGSNSRRANIDDLAFTLSSPPLPTSATVAAKALLEGAYNGSDMNTKINSSISLTQPYSFNGHSGGTASSIPSGAVEWVLVELRESTTAATANNATKVGSAAGFLMSDGSIKATNGTSDLTISLSGNTGADFFIVVYHRNHLPIMSANAISESSGVYTVDYTSSASNTYQGGTALSSLVGGKFGMIAGDQNADGQVNSTDLASWRTQNGSSFSYAGSSADFNLDGQVNAVDRNDFQQPNSGKSSQVPTN